MIRGRRPGAVIASERPSRLENGMTNQRVSLPFDGYVKGALKWLANEMHNHSINPDALTRAG